jgi:hypothetical protein
MLGYGQNPCLAGALVGHPVHGRGTVLYKFGDIRMVEFQNKFDKTFDEMTEEERLEVCGWGDDVVGMTWTETHSRFVPVAQLKLFAQTSKNE